MKKGYYSNFQINPTLNLADNIVTNTNWAADNGKSGDLT